jgi:hypothetical protein
MKFLNYVPKFLDIKELYKTVYPDSTEKGTFGI